MRQFLRWAQSSSATACVLRQTFGQPPGSDDSELATAKQATRRSVKAIAIAGRKTGKGVSGPWQLIGNTGVDGDAKDGAKKSSEERGAGVGSSRL